MRIIEDVKPKAKAFTSDTQLCDPGITFNETGISFNEAGYTFGGVYGSIYSDKPRIVHARDFQGTATAATTGVPMGLLLALTYAT